MVEAWRRTIGSTASLSRGIAHGGMKIMCITNLFLNNFIKGNFCWLDKNSRCFVSVLDIFFSVNTVAFECDILQHSVDILQRFTIYPPIIIMYTVCLNTQFIQDIEVTGARRNTGLNTSPAA
jgi:hypothetical protein